MRHAVEDGLSSFITRVVLRYFAQIDQHIRTNTTTILTPYSHCITQLISLLGQVIKDECALVTHDFIEMRNPL